MNRPTVKLLSAELGSNTAEYLKDLNYILDAALTDLFIRNTTAYQIIVTERKAGKFSVGEVFVGYRPSGTGAAILITGPRPLSPEELEVNANLPLAYQSQVCAPFSFDMRLSEQNIDALGIAFRVALKYIAQIQDAPRQHHASLKEALFSPRKNS